MKKIVMLIIILGFSSLVAAATPANTTHSSYPPVPDSVSSPPLVIHLVCHYIENLPDKPKNNEELLEEYVRAYKSLRKAVASPISSEYDHGHESNHGHESPKGRESTKGHAEPSHEQSPRH
ncbi:MAG: hypothetical protein ACMUIP_01030 [bacterium]